MEFSSVLLAVACSMFAFAMTTLGSSFVYLIKQPGKKIVTQISLGFAAGIMLSAAFWGLIIPAFEKAEELSLNAQLHVTLGIVVGIAFLILLDKSLPHLHILAKTPEGPHITLSKKILILSAITIHNIPEGMAIGISAVAVSSFTDPAYASAVMLSVGIGIQNIPEGCAVSVPFFAEGTTKNRSFLLGMFSGIVEPIAAIAVAIFAAGNTELLPFMLAFAAGAMLYVVIEELIPEAHLAGHSDIGTISVLSGFTLMMILDTAFG
ncbi:MAG: ZIP family metal transporter [Succinivibrio sp.]|nr:ZIP family metal transporter [Succinivibrio sp.]